MKSLLVAVEPGDGLEWTMQTAAAMARRLGAVLVGTFVNTHPPTVLVASSDGLAAAAAHEMIEEFQVQERDRQATARQAFLTAMTDSGLPLLHSSEPNALPGAAWNEATASGLEELTHLAAVYDLVVIGRPSRGQQAPSMAALEAVLFSSGRPLLIAPPRTCDPVGQHIAIAWKTSPETARTVALAAPLLTRAARVQVLSIDGGEGHDPGAERLTRHLIRNGAPAELTLREAKERPLGQAILEEAGALNADLIVKGAYTQSRLSQLIFGGATRHILCNANVPVFMAH